MILSVHENVAMLKVRLCFSQVSGVEFLDVFRLRGIA